MAAPSWYIDSSFPSWNWSLSGDFHRIYHLFDNSNKTNGILISVDIRRAGIVRQKKLHHLGNFRLNKQLRYNKRMKILPCIYWRRRSCSFRQRFLHRFWPKPWELGSKFTNNHVLYDQGTYGESHQPIFTVDQRIVVGIGKDWLRWIEVHGWIVTVREDTLLFVLVLFPGSVDFLLGQVFFGFML